MISLSINWGGDQNCLCIEESIILCSNYAKIPKHMQNILLHVFYVCKLSDATLNKFQMVIIGYNICYIPIKLVQSQDICMKIDAIPTWHISRDLAANRANTDQATGSVVQGYKNWDWVWD